MKTLEKILWALLPFIAVWIAWIITAFSFEIRWVFIQDEFWGLSIVYWLLYAFVLLVNAVGEDE